MPLTQVRRNETIEDQTIEMDETILIKCRVLRCTLIFRGGETCWVDTFMEGCGMLWVGNAAHMVKVMQAFGWRPPEGIPLAPPSLTPPTGLVN